jgi:hypothetical protein
LIGFLEDFNVKNCFNCSSYSFYPGSVSWIINDLTDARENNLLRLRNLAQLERLLYKKQEKPNPFDEG